ncbi:two-component regulator propeller domain-containing protein [uncultured Bacteroides sp.]|jgi:ligand-binding sensor domain-containing protein|uniref:ligand-binding sensor domain-containing protein n=1 Tax=uncultured Bacteroides sp. TaxID=162156 RepID=UPI00280C25FC|nr:two-component regulator propeller domain-containing protein [uncultured Bacteroides sp.]
MKAILTILLGCLAQLTFSQNLIFFDKEKIGSQSINALCQDNDNFLWIGTKHGLHRFDGTRFVSYFHDRQDSCSLKDNEVHSLYVDNRQTLWIGTASGLQRYLPESDNFQSVVLDNADTGGRITGILQCSDNTLLCNVSGTGIFQVDIKTMRAHPIMKDTYSPYILCMLEDNQKYLWIGTDRQGIIRTNPFTGEKKDMTCH